MALINGMYITVQSESPSFPVTVTEQPVEKGINLIDHVQAQARTLSISGIIAGTKAAKTRADIISVKDKGQIVGYVGRNGFVGVITDFSTATDYTTADGMTFSMELREVRVAAASYVDTLPPPIKAQAAPIVNSGTKQTKGKGDGKGKGTGKDKDKDKGKDKDKDKVQQVKFKPGSKWNK